ncbi:alkaline phosphatase-like protein [Cutaneotrichosporon oleaginosum]|uniref:alkaline phosphatase n=1 Tax=Cutaneotrichosporon oleaginosum TaxID=879819 RepID=A0A0J0XDX3_9TREE|nr:alkaline phosphatase-like protein [Cutaneotrichosporon oleaginosum]KLT39305.1 alkaline phosphatase-like protein [Cutaneotrichosporon oleaginosum]TXT08562.1 hypothetical protein COLE_05486 [Cutaneotrichosporon oleaginosum]
MVALQLLAAALAATAVHAQTFRRTAACPKLGCVFPPDQVNFIAGQTFDIRVEVQAPINGTQAFNGGKVDPNFKLEIGGEGAELIDVTQFFGLQDPKPESYNFTWYEDLFAEDAKTPSAVNVIAKSYRNVQLHNPGRYKVRLTFNGGDTQEATWEVNPIPDCAKAKNLLFFVGDGMATSMISAARLLAHKMINGKYQTHMAFDSAQGYGSQMTHSLDSFITDSANSASSLFTGHKMTVNGLNAYTDSTGKPYNNAKVETVFEMFRRTTGGQVGAVSSAFIADATPAAICAHTSQRSQYHTVIEQYLSGVTMNHSWTPWGGVDVLFGGGAESFIASAANGNVDQFDRWGQHGYQVGFNKTQLEAFSNDQRALAIFTRGNVSTWLDRHIYTDALKYAVQPDGTQGAYDQPGLKDMTIKAIDILSTRAKARGTGWALMSEAALIDKNMHVGDIDRALGDLLELDDTVRAALKHLEEIGELEQTLIVVTADHGHGFDVFGSADTKYLKEQKEDRKKRDAVGVYENSGLSAYVVPKNVSPTTHEIFENPQGHFPITWDPRYTLAHGYAAVTDRREDYEVSKEHERIPSALGADKTQGYFFNPNDSPDGFAMTGNLNTQSGQGVHSLVDVPIYAWSAGHELFRGVMSNVDIAFRVADALGLGHTSNVTKPYKP